MLLDEFFGLFAKGTECDVSVAALKSGEGLILVGVVVYGGDLVAVGVAAQDGDEVGGVADGVVESKGAGLVAGFGPALAAFDFVVFVSVPTPGGVAEADGVTGITQ